MTKIALRSLLHLHQHGCGDLLREELMLLTLPLDLHLRLSTSSLYNLERPMLDIILNHSIIKLATNETLGVKNSVRGVCCSLILCCIANETVFLGESDVGRRCTISLVVSDNFYSSILPDTYSTVRSTQINSDGNTRGGHFYQWLLPTCSGCFLDRFS